MSYPIPDKRNTVPYGWIIDTDNVTNAEDHAKHEATGGKEGLRSRKGWIGPRNASETVQKALKAGKGRKFRMLYDTDEANGHHEHSDDNKPIPYTGRLFVESEDDCGSEAEFSPLDNLGTPDAGCVHIQYKVKGKWEIL